MLMDRHFVAGPEQIGIRGNRLEGLLNRQNSRGGGRYNNNRGGYRRSGGGGSRYNNRDNNRSGGGRRPSNRFKRDKRD